jgi:hypothetical protein
MSDLRGIFGGLVEDNKDPEKLGRLKVRVPHVYGAVSSTFGAVTTNDLPWALPVGLPAGGSNASGGISMLPAVGDQVAVQFLDGEPEKPVWQWFMQSQQQASTLHLHQYEANGGPNRVILTVYGHSLEMTQEQVTLTTAEGYELLLAASTSESGGSATMQTPAGQSVSLSDMGGSAVIQGIQSAVLSAENVALNGATSTLVKTARFSLMVGTSLVTIQGNQVIVTTGSGASLIIDDAGNIAINSAGRSSLSLENALVQLAEPTGTGLVIESGKVSVNAPQMVINTGALSVGNSQGSPVLLLTQSMQEWLLTHTHSNGNDGSPTGPPIPIEAGFPQDAASQRMQAS